MITSPSGKQLVSVHGQGPMGETLYLSQFRDAAGYSKQTPANAAPVTLDGVLYSDPPRIAGLAATDGLVGAAVSGPGVAPGTTVVEVTKAAVAATNTNPGVLGVVGLSAQPPAPLAPPVDPAAPPAAPPVAPEPPKPAEPGSYVFARVPEAITIPDGVSRLQLSPKETLAALSVTLPCNPVDGQMAFIYSTEEISALTVSPNEGQVLNDPVGYAPVPPPVEVDPAVPVVPAPKAEPAPVKDAPKHGILPARTSIGYLYSAENKTWDRIE